MIYYIPTVFTVVFIKTSSSICLSLWKDQAVTCDWSGISKGRSAWQRPSQPNQMDNLTHKGDCGGPSRPCPHPSIYFSDNFDLKHIIKIWISLCCVTFRLLLSKHCLRDGSRKRIKSVQPVIHLSVISSLQQYSTMFCAHSKCVRGLFGKSKKNKAYSPALTGVFFIEVSLQICPRSEAPKAKKLYLQ